MERICPVSNSTFTIAEEDLNFYSMISPRVGNEVVAIPPPTLSPDMRLRRRLSYRNQIYLFSRPSASDGKRLFSIYPEESNLHIVSNDEWWSDSWDARTYGRDFDFSRPFFEQFAALRTVVPMPARSGVELHNSEYSSNASHLKDCYFVFNTSKANDCMYCENAWGSTNCVECTHVKYSELCYDCINCENCYNLQSSLDCNHVQDSYFMLNCIGCRNCYGCVNLRRQEYMVFNRKVGKQGYLDFLARMDLSKASVREQQRAEVLAFWQSYPRPHAFTRQVENVSGDQIVESENVQDSFHVGQARDVRFGFLLYEGVRDCYDCTIPGINAERLYEGLQCGINASNSAFCIFCVSGSARLYYCHMCSSSTDSFGCVGLKQAEYCILNKQYEKEEYFSLLRKIIAHMHQTGEWGEFFPMSHSPIPYNISLAHRYFPLTETQAEQAGLQWMQPRTLSASSAISSADLPDGVPDDDEAIDVRSELSGKPFRITSREIAWCRKANAPLPRRTYDERMDARATIMGGLKLYNRRCQKTGVEIKTTIPPGTPWILWDRSVWEQEVN